MQSYPVWTWDGHHFGYMEGEYLWTHDGKNVGRLRGEIIYAPDGSYLGDPQRKSIAYQHENKIYSLAIVHGEARPSWH